MVRRAPIGGDAKRRDDSRGRQSAWYAGIRRRTLTSPGITPPRQKNNGIKWGGRGRRSRKSQRVEPYLKKAHIADDNPSILSHVSVGTNDVDHAAAFYDKVLASLRCKHVMEFRGAINYGKAFPEFWVIKTF
jgi:hypothetical protein